MVSNTFNHFVCFRSLWDYVERDAYAKSVSFEGLQEKITENFPGAVLTPAAFARIVQTHQMALVPERAKIVMEAAVDMDVGKTGQISSTELRAVVRQMGRSSWLKNDSAAKKLMKVVNNLLNK